MVVAMSSSRILTSNGSLVWLLEHLLDINEDITGLGTISKNEISKELNRGLLYFCVSHAHACTRNIYAMHEAQLEGCYTTFTVCLGEMYFVSPCGTLSNNACASLGPVCRVLHPKGRQGWPRAARNSGKSLQVALPTAVRPLSGRAGRTCWPAGPQAGCTYLIQWNSVFRTQTAGSYYP